MLCNVLLLIPDKPAEVTVANQQATSSSVRVEWKPYLDSLNRSKNLDTLVKFSIIQGRWYERVVHPPETSYTVNSLRPSTVVSFELSTLDSSGREGPVTITTIETRGEIYPFMHRIYVYARGPKWS